MHALAVALALVCGNSIDKDLVKRVIQAKATQFRGCYETALKSDGPGFSGKASLTITIESEGTVSDVKVVFPREAPKFTDCVHDVAMTLKFPKFPPPGPIKIIWPIVFAAP